MKPLIGLPADTADNKDVPFHSIGDKYVRAVAEAAGGIPLVIPALASVIDLDSLLDRLDGLVLTGALSNVHPSRYGASAHSDYEPYDQARDDTTIPLIGKAVARGMPLLCICRGYQELNVVLGGTLATEIQRIKGRLDHRAPKVDDLDQRYGPRHVVNLERGGLLHEILGAERIMVNSLHRQAIDRLAPRLKVEATAEDGTIEAVSIRDGKGFVLGVQWHPEYKAIDNPVSVRIFRAFGDAARRYSAARQTGFAAA
ncbi:gamma-glutamyl-gamma-aminobutyrate hydrolase family protein [Rhodoligotrophos defluvii]|uniref:gamma-glutamyl-gamma-aminobutyrate hydrolase family protein n=1 Tax=Rhodoligotrophos defluvii TaxID=2561934 RepID=UPI001EF0F355|nr:gamma-glutamyl-gamma-aminobutyrate hydrolase family protein [Rhodoligotrophos defluvii]